MDSDNSQASQFRLGPFEIKGQENLLITPDGPATLLPKVMALLLYLCRHPERVVTFDELNAAIWPNEVVGDNAIYNLVGQLRKALGDSASQPTYIQTLSKKGYRLLVPAQPMSTVRSVSSSAEKLAVQRLSAPIPIGWSAIAIIALLGLLAWGLFKPTDTISTAAQQQLEVARYQLYRGDGEGVEQGIDSLQKAVVLAPTWPIPKVELGYAFVRMARLQPQQESVWHSKALAISDEAALGARGERLKAITHALQNPPGDSAVLQLRFAGDNILVSARLAYGDVLFDRGFTEQALAQHLAALEDCVNCPYVYRRVATSTLVLGKVEESFEYFSRYQLLTNKAQHNPLDSAGHVVLAKQRLPALANWLYHTPVAQPLPPHQRNALALLYLAMGDVKAAELLVASIAPNSDNFFDLYTQAALAGAKGDFAASMALLQQRQRVFPDNPRFKLSVVYALWQLGRHQQALEQFKSFDVLEVQEVLPANMPFEIWSLYGALELAAGDKLLGRKVLSALKQQLLSGTLPGSHQADIRLAAVQALLGERDEALAQLQISIQQGWVSDFHQSWWYLEDAPYFSSLQTDPRFTQLVSDYHQGIADLVSAAKSSK